jgi:RHS repeat-associated protein
MLETTLSALDNDTHGIDSVKLGAIGVDSGTDGALYFDDFDSRRFSTIGTLTQPPQAEASEGQAGWQRAVYDYTDPAQPGKPHAVKSVARSAGTDVYTYDLNGNMTCRIEDGVTYIHSYNAENRLSKVELVTGDCDSYTVAQTWDMAYDGDGSRVKQVHDDGTTVTTSYYFGGGLYEVVDDGTTESTTKYYSLAGMRIGMDDGSAFSYLLSDHLGSVNMLISDTGTMLSEQRYLPFGGVRGDVGSVTETDFGYTGQRAVAGFGLMDYNARFYSPLLGKFTQPDTIVPDPGNPQAWNRYAYNINNPVRYVDPTGHGYCASVYADSDLCEGEVGSPDAKLKVGGEEDFGVYSNWNRCLQTPTNQTKWCKGDGVVETGKSDQGGKDQNLLLQVVSLNRASNFLKDLLFASGETLLNILGDRKGIDSTLMEGLGVGAAGLLQLFQDRNSNLPNYERIARAEIVMYEAVAIGFASQVGGAGAAVAAGVVCSPAGFVAIGCFGAGYAGGTIVTVALGTTAADMFNEYVAFPMLHLGLALLESTSSKP